MKVELSEIQRIHRQHVGRFYGSLTPEEVDYIQQLMVRHRPTSFIEIGTASGLTAGLMARVLDELGGGRLVTIDHDNAFFGDPTKENGFLIPIIYPSGRVEVVRRPFTTAMSLPGSGEAFDMAFVDANHQHPWPLMDTLCLVPALRGPKLVVHDDLIIYRTQRTGRGIGPKHLFDQFPESHRDRATVSDGNMFSLSLDLPVEAIETIAQDAFAIPWTLTIKLDEERLEAFRDVLRAHYSPELLAVFDECAAKYNFPTGRMFKKHRPPVPGGSAG